MDTKHRFDFVHDAQGMFRLLLDAMANPGRVGEAREYAEKFETAGNSGKNGIWLALAAVLLDNEVTYWSNIEKKVKDEIHFLTGAMESEMEQADYLFVDGNEDPEAVMAKVKSGTHTEPEKSALLVIREKEVPDISRTFHGPGIPPEGRRVFLGGREQRWIDARNNAGFEYPCGIELMFVRWDGSFLIITRKAGEQ